MKKFILAAAAVLFVTSAVSAQSFDKGTIFASARTTNLELNIMPNFSIGVAAEGGYFFADKFAVIGGLRLEGGGGFTIFGLNAGVRYHFYDSFFGQADFNLLKPGAGDMQFGLGLAAGYSWFLIDRVALEPALRLNIPFAAGSQVELGATIGISVFF